MDRLVRVCSAIFGYLLLALSIVVVVETLGRKFFGFSLQGADELGGYVFAVSSTLAFTVALVERGHIRIDLLRSFMPRLFAAATDWLAATLMLCFSALLAWACFQVLRETVEYGSVAPSPWATPLVYPQSFWLVCMLLFFSIALWLAIHATKLLFSGRIAELVKRHGAKSLQDELTEELQDASRR